MVRGRFGHAQITNHVISTASQITTTTNTQNQCDINMDMIGECEDMNCEWWRNVNHWRALDARMNMHENESDWPRVKEVELPMTEWGTCLHIVVFLKLEFRVLCLCRLKIVTFHFLAVWCQSKFWGRFRSICNMQQNAIIVCKQYAHYILELV